MKIVFDVILKTIVFFGAFLAPSLAVFAIPTFVGFVVWHKIKRGHFMSPFVLLDLITFFGVGIAWYLGGAFPTLTFLNKDWSNVFVELGGLGMIYGLFLLARAPIVWRHSDCRHKCALITLVVMLVISFCVGVFVPPLGGDC